MLKKSSWPGIIMVSAIVTFTLAWIEHADTAAPQPRQAVQSTPTAAVTPLPTETWRIVLPTPTPWPTERLVILPRQPVTPSPESTPNIWSSAVCGCASDVYSCSDFVSQEAAQLCWNWCADQTGGEDVHDLVLDDTSDIYAWDGWACITIEEWIEKGQ